MILGKMEGGKIAEQKLRKGDLLGKPGFSYENGNKTCKNWL